MTSREWVRGVACTAFAAAANVVTVASKFRAFRTEEAVQAARRRIRGRPSRSRPGFGRERPESGRRKSGDRYEARSRQPGCRARREPGAVTHIPRSGPRSRPRAGSTRGEGCAPRGAGRDARRPRRRGPERPTRATRGRRGRALVRARVRLRDGSKRERRSGVDVRYALVEQHHASRDLARVGIPPEALEGGCEERARDHRDLQGCEPTIEALAPHPRAVFDRRGAHEREGGEQRQDVQSALRGGDDQDQQPSDSPREQHPVRSGQSPRPQRGRAALDEPEQPQTESASPTGSASPTESASPAGSTSPAESPARGGGRPAVLTRGRDAPHSPAVCSHDRGGVEESTSSRARIGISIGIGGARR